MMDEIKGAEVRDVIPIGRDKPGEVRPAATPSPCDTPVAVRSEIIDTLACMSMPSDRSFGRALMPVIAVASYRDGEWSDIAVKYDHEQPVSAGSVAVQYAQSIFEGMKAYKIQQERPQLFRVHDHAARFLASAERLCMPPVPEALFVRAVSLVARLYERHIPQEPDSALYLRPALFGTDYSLEIAPSAKYAFTVHAAPTVPFSREPISVLVERRASRAAVGGTGAVKAAGNYAGGFHSLGRARALGCATSLWLDPHEGRYIEELSLMNFFAVVRGTLMTPKLEGSFLPGITRKSLMTLARHSGLQGIEERMDIDDLIRGIRDGDVSEAFSTGTAAVVSPVRALKELDGTEHVISEEIGPITRQLRRMLLDIQEGRANDSYGWMTDA